MKKRNRPEQATQNQNNKGRLLELKRETVRDLSEDQLDWVNGGTSSCYNPPAES